MSRVVLCLCAVLFVGIFVFGLTWMGVTGKKSVCAASASVIPPPASGFAAEIAFQDATQIRVKVTSGLPVVGESDGYATLLLSGTEDLLSSGDPRLVQRAFRLALPPDADLSSVEVTLGETSQQDIVLDQVIEPAPPVATWDSQKNIYEWGPDKTIVDGRNMRVYGQDALYPATALSPVRCGQLREWKVVQFAVYPLQYNPVSGRVRVLTSADISVRYRLAAAKSAAAPRDGAMNELAGTLLDNFNEALPMYPVASPTKAGTYPYVILTTNAIVDASSMLAQFEVSQELAGRTVLTVTEDGRYDDLDGAKSAGGWGGGVGDEAAENLRMWLQDNYETLSTQYVLLIGNPAPASGDVPMKMTDPGDLEIPTDFYYADLTGNWDRDGDDVFGEIGDDYPGGFDGLADVHVGRIPEYRSTPEFLDAILLKTIAYENAPTTEAWRTRLLLPAKPFDEETSASYVCEAIRSDFAIPESWPSFRIYEADYGFAPEKTPCSVNGVVTEWQKAYGLVTWFTHGSSTSAADILATGNVLQLDDTCPAFTFQCSCFNGNPDVAGNLGYTLLQHGAVSTVSASREGWYVVGDANWSSKGSCPNMAYEYSGAIIQGYRAGEALSQVRTAALGANYLEVYHMRNAFVFNLYGDPAARILSESGGSSMIMRSAPRIEAHASPNGPVDDQTFELWALGPDVSYAITETPAVSWLSVAPSSGTASSARSAITLSFNSSGLGLGAYSTVLRIAAPGAANSPLAIPVSFRIDRPIPELVDTWGWTWETGGAGEWHEETSNTHDGMDAARTPALESGQSSWCSTTVTGPGALSFWWTSEMEGADLVGFYIDGKWIANLQGTKPWAQVSKYLEEGTHTLLWHFKNAGTAAAGLDVAVLDQVVFVPETLPYAVMTPFWPSMKYEEGQLPEPLTFRVWNGGLGTLSYTLALNVNWLELSTVSGSSKGEVDEIVVTPVAGLFPPPTSTATLTLTAEGAANSPLTRTISVPKVTNFVSLGEGLDAPELPWVTSGYVLWSGDVVSTHDGADSVMCGTPPGLQTSDLAVTLEGPGVLTFWRNVMIESGMGFLTITIDGEPQGPPLTGLTGAWVQDELEIGPGFHEVTWVVTRTQISTGSWFRVGLDEVVFVQHLPKIGLEPEMLAPACLPGKDAPSETFEVWNSGTEELTYSVVSTVPWISVSPASGTSTGEHDVITVTYDTSSLSTGLHEGEIRVMIPGQASSRSIPVRLDIGNRVDVTFKPSRDTTIYEDGERLSNGAGQYVVVGEGIGFNVTRRGLLAFDLSSIPSNATIGEVTLEVDALGSDSGMAIGLFAAGKAWGEGTSDAAGTEVDGASCTTNDATWRYSKYNTAEWTTAGGDFDPDTPLVSTAIAGDGTYTWPSTPEFVADVQRLVINYKSNYGWFLAATGRTVVGTKRILSRQNGDPDLAPRLHVTYYMDPVPTQTVPNVVGNTLANAQAAIEAADLAVGQVTRQYDNTVPKDSVVSQSPAAGTLLLPGADVNLVVSDGPAFVRVPNVVGQTAANAEAQLIAAGFVVGAKQNAFTTYSSGLVARQTPSSKEMAAPGSAVDLVVSLGKGTTKVPNLVGLTQVEARAALGNAWLVLGTVTQEMSQTVSPGRVISQRTAANTFVTTGSSVGISVSIGVGTTEVPDLTGLTVDEAEAAIEAAFLVVGDVTEEYSITVSADHVMSQSVEPGTTVARASTLSFVVSLGEATVVVPSVVGQTQAAAQMILEQVGFTLGSVSEAYSSTVAAGLAISQDPVADTAVPFGYAINLVLSKGVAPVTVPNVVGLSQSAAAAAITGAGLTIGTVTQAYSSTVPAGYVISQDPAAGTSVAPGTAVSGVVSKGPQPVTVPNVVGMAQATAQASITGAGLTVGTVTEAYSPTVVAGSVISQNPAAAASVAPGTAVALVVSKGPQPVTVPNVVGMTQSAASTAITSAGLTVGTVTEAYSSIVAAGSVISQNPAAASSVAPGTAVALVVSKGPQPVTVPDVVGMTQSAASTAITSAGLTVGTVTEAYSSTVAAGSVISQNPAAASSVAPGTAVALVVSKGPQPVTVPDVVGQSEANAQTAILGAGFIMGSVVAVHHATVPLNAVISQDPAAGVSAVPGTAVNLVISSGPGTNTVPTVTGLLLSAATNTITSAGFTLGTVTEAYSATVAAGYVISQNPAAGASAAPGAAVALVVSKGPQPVTVPNVVGTMQAAATTAITGAGLTVGTVTQVYHATIASGIVISQDPASGASVAPGASVALVVSKGPQPVTVPNVVGMTQVTASASIVGASLTVGTITEAYSATVAAGNVISQNPAAGASVGPGTAVALVVSKGSQPVSVPNVVGMTQSAAATAITSAGLTLGTVSQAYSATVVAGKVISQNPVAGASVGPGTAVVLVVSKGQQPVTVPDVVGMTQITASASIVGANLTVGTISEAYSATVPAGNVISQNPVAGTSVAPGTAVALVVSKGAQSVSVPNVVGMTQAAATTALTGAGLTRGTVTEAYSPTVIAGNVISQNPVAGTSVASGAAVALVVSKGPEEPSSGGCGSVTDEIKSGGPGTGRMGDGAILGLLLAALIASTRMNSRRYAQ